MHHPALDFDRDYLLSMVHCERGVPVGFLSRPATFANYASAVRLAMVAADIPLSRPLR